MALDRTHLNVALIGVSQALVMTCGVVFFTTAALVGQGLANDKGLATVPVATMWIGATLTTVPASFLMRRVGRRTGFQIGILVGICGGLLAAYGIMRGSFVLFTAGSALFGIANGFNGFYRFAAVDAARPDFKGMALSLVMLGGVLGGIVGPQLAKRTVGMLPDATYAGSYLTLATVFFVAFFVMATVNIPFASAAERLPTDRSLFAMLSQPTFAIAMLGAGSAFSVMTFLMTATPLAVQHHGHDFADVADVIQIHVLGMFAPSFITGFLIRRFGVLNIMLAGVLLNVLCVITNFTGGALLSFWVALALLGIGWNFLYIGASTLLIEAYRPAETARAQGVNDFTVLAVVTAASLTSGYAHNTIGWIAMNVAVLVPMGIALVGLLWLMSVRRTSVPVAA